MIFLNYASSVAALVLYLPDTEGKQRKAKIRHNLKSSEKTQYLMNTPNEQLSDLSGYIVTWIL